MTTLAAPDHRIRSAADASSSRAHRSTSRGFFAHAAAAAETARGERLRNVGGDVSICSGRPRRWEWRRTAARQLGTPTFEFRRFNAGRLLLLGSRVILADLPTSHA